MVMHNKYNVAGATRKHLKLNDAVNPRNWRSRVELTSLRSL